MLALLAAFKDTTDPIFGMTPFELILGFVVIVAICWFVSWLVRTFKP